MADNRSFVLGDWTTLIGSAKRGTTPRVAGARSGAGVLETDPQFGFETLVAGTTWRISTSFISHLLSRSLRDRRPGKFDVH